MIEKMKFVSITGPREDIDRVVNNYLSRYEIHLENALTELTDVKNLSPYLEINPYTEASMKRLRTRSRLLRRSFQSKKRSLLYSRSKTKRTF